MLPRRAPVVVLLLAGSLALHAAQPPAAPTSSQRIVSGTSAIVVDVVVRDGKGNPVTDLSKADFELLEDGVRQEIGDASHVTGARQADTPPGVPPSTRPTAAAVGKRFPSFTAIVFNRLSPEARGRAYKAALASLDALQGGDYVAVFSTDVALTTLLSYSTDQDRLRRALADAARRASWSSPVGITATGAFTLFADWELPAAAGAVHAATQASWEELERHQTGFATTGALAAIAAGLGVVPGRKTVVLFSEGIPVPEAVLPQLESVIASAGRANVSIYPIDTAGLRTASQQAAAAAAVNATGHAGITLTPTGENMNSLGQMGRMDAALRTPSVVFARLARETGGFVIEHTNDYAKGFRQIDADRRSYYLLTYAPRNTTFDGKWRSIVVRVPGRPVTVRARSGYLAVRTPPGVPLLDYEAPALAALERSSAPADLALRAGAFAFPGRQVVVVAATDASALAFARDGASRTYRTDFLMLARIVDATGQVVRKASQPYRLSGPVQQMEQARRGEILFFRQPSLPAGSYTLEVAVHDALATRSGVHRSAFIVPDSSPTLQVSSLVIVQRAERVPPDERRPDNPLYAGDLVIYPNLSEPTRRSRQKTLPIYAMVAPAAGTSLTATIEVVRDGAVVAQAPATLAAVDGTGRLRCLMEMPLDGLATGRYILRLRVVQGDRREIRETTFHLID